MTIRDLYPDIKPSLNLDFANTKSLDPRVDFDRSSTATYYDGQTFAKAEENLLKYSQEFDKNAQWDDTFVGGSRMRRNIDILTQDQTAPDGTTTAYTIGGTTQSAKTFGKGWIRPPHANFSGAKTILVFLKYTNTQFVSLVFSRVESSNSFDLAVFDVANGVVSGLQTISSPTNISITSVGGGWYRCSFTTTRTSGALGIAIGLLPSGTANSFDTNGRTDTNTSANSTVAMWGFQYEARDQVTAYTPTTDQPITNYIPVLKTAAPNEPRFDHDPVTGEFKGLLIEGQRTNLVPDSTAFSGSGWREGNTTVEQNVAVAPNGLIEAAKITGTGGSLGNNLRYYIYTGTSTGNFTVSVYAKKGNYKYIKLHPFAKTTTHDGAVFDLETGTVVNNSDVTSKIEPVGNGWYRCQVTPTFSYFNTIWGISITDYTGFSDSDSKIQAPEGSFVFVWGAQTEYNSGGFISSHIPTSGSQVTRVADSASITGENFSEWYRQDEGTLYAEFSPNQNRSVNDSVFTIDDGSVSNEIRNIGSYYQIRNNNTLVVNDTTAFSVTAGNHKIIAAYKTNDCASSNDGATVRTDTDATIPNNLKTLRIGTTFDSRYLDGNIKKLAFYPKRLPNAVLQALTKE